MMVPTKSNLIIAKNTLKLSRTGYELLDRKRNILIREMMTLIDTAKSIQSEISETFSNAYDALQRANIELGITNVERIGYAAPIENGITVKMRSVMGVSIPIVNLGEDADENTPIYGFANTTATLDEAYRKFKEVKRLTSRLAQIENSVYRLADSIKRTQKRANALKNITIPRYEEETKNIQNALEEKDREEFSRLKIIKNRK